MHAGREEGPLSCARDDGDEARLRGCLILILPIMKLFTRYSLFVAVIRFDGTLYRKSLLQEWCRLGRWTTIRRAQA
jgi:hypothetical protein